MQLDEALLWPAFSPEWFTHLRAGILDEPYIMIDNGYDMFIGGWPERPACRFLIRKQGKAYCGIETLFDKAKTANIYVKQIR